jgi:hypothetical protein
MSKPVTRDERLPLSGRRIVVTRANGRPDPLPARLGALGAAVIEIPTIEIRPAADYAPLDGAIANLSSYDWLIFTSANGVRFFLDRLDRSTTDLRALRARICAIGPATRAEYAALIARSKTIVWNGPMGVFEIDQFAAGTLAIARAVAASSAVSVVGGGDSVAAVKKAGVESKITHISTGGGASLEFLSGLKLPGVEALTEKQ